MSSAPENPERVEGPSAQLPDIAARPAAQALHDLTGWRNRPLTEMVGPQAVAAALYRRIGLAPPAYFAPGVISGRTPGPPASAQADALQEFTSQWLAAPHTPHMSHIPPHLQPEAAPNPEPLGFDPSDRWLMRDSARQVAQLVLELDGIARSCRLPDENTIIAMLSGCMERAGMQPRCNFIIDNKNRLHVLLYPNRDDGGVLRVAVLRNPTFSVQFRQDRSAGDNHAALRRLEFDVSPPVDE